MQEADMFPASSLAENVRQMQNLDANRAIANRNTFNGAGTLAGYFDADGKWISGTRGGFYTSKGGEWCEGSVSGGYFTPTG